ncbi:MULTISPECIES: phosphotransferase family protein [Anaerolinea]|uniref:phosphotransferase family protein n=1 Tax=Anaerolinea TaxID=233189 RepID=UPI00261D2505|nr:aminoglycoside phosphotransferase family protein [Anaerolinea thermophila]
MEETPGTPVAYGRTAEIYAWHDDTVLKLFYDWFSFENIQYEWKIARAVQSSGLPVPVVGEILHIHGRYGITYQHIQGNSMVRQMMREPWKVFHYARKMADLHARIHAITLQTDLPPLRAKIATKIHQAAALPDDLRQETLQLLENMPDGDRLCHGDFHPENILITPQGEWIIDWIDAGIGNPLADVARTTVIFLGAIDSGQMRNPILKILAHLFHQKYLRRYFALHGGGKDEYTRWLPIVAAARLSENIAELEAYLIAQVEKGLRNIC